MKNLILLIFCITLAACSVSISSILNTPTKPVLDVSIERSGCLGMCPVYKLKIQADGTVDYEGISFVKIEGKRSTNINSNQIEELVKAINDADFFSLENHYSSCIPAIELSSMKDQICLMPTDLPSINLAITLNGRTKSIEHYGGVCGGSLPDAPEKFCELVSKIEEVVNSSQWVKEDKPFGSVEK